MEVLSVIDGGGAGLMLSCGVPQASEIVTQYGVAAYRAPILINVTNIEIWMSSLGDMLAGGKGGGCKWDWRPWRQSNYVKLKKVIFLSVTNFKLLNKKGN